jgi:S1-C subfamily serine protease
VRATIHLALAGLALAAPAPDRGPPGSGYLGVSVRSPENPDAKGLQIVRVTPGGAAEAAGIRQGDFIWRVEGVEVERVGQLGDKLKRYGAGEYVEIELIRGDKVEKLRVKLGHRPKESEAEKNRDKPGKP